MNEKAIELYESEFGPLDPSAKIIMREIEMSDALMEAVAYKQGYDDGAQVAQSGVSLWLPFALLFCFVIGRYSTNKKTPWRLDQEES